MRGLRMAVLGVAVLAGLHLLMLVGGGEVQRANPHCPANPASQVGVAHPGPVAHATQAIPMTTPLAASEMASDSDMDRGALASAVRCHQAGWHHLAVSCLAILGSLTIVVAALAMRAGRAGDAARPRRWVAPVVRPPTPPPMALGILRV